jgi:hypothetical protein
MDGDPFSLDKLRDIVVPDPPPLWPPAPGMWVAICTVLLVVLVAGWLIHSAWKRNAYRKAGLMLLSEAKTVHDVSVVMKRVALAAFPREQVASLYGDDWATFLHKTCPEGDFSSLITVGAGAQSSRELVDLAGIWIRDHQVPDVGTLAAAN